ncbi:5'-methylthioadenosine/S-adenosylhomocysteine nucleosidase [uncultured Bifidobacterium sp.]|uniref:5'-methylthioadenosine/S-adenosylhomocysteine nucleosidase n=1 Tax=uncultured Bifidobacterium sp. TaxID=165187 RepID=UPI0028DD307F|nr:5'-methylthioadenosine/S-adenosylhomocysteine nucleosidase [uncultured Bifidobacterium sp.]
MDEGRDRCGRSDVRDAARIPTVAVIGALEEETALIAGRLRRASTASGAGIEVVDGLLDAASGGLVHVAVTVGGMGLVNAAATTQRLIDVHHPDAVIFSGIAGNLNPDLHVNDVVIGGTVRYLDTDMKLVSQWAPKLQEFRSDDRLVALADEVLTSRGIPHITGIIASGNRFVDTDELRRSAVLQTGADAVEMEGAAVLHVAGRNRVRGLVIRALSDNADTAYDEFSTFDVSRFADTAAAVATDILRRLDPTTLGSGRCAERAVQG